MQTKISHILNIAYALVVAFAVIGGIFKPGELPLMILFFAVLTWSAVRIIHAGVDSSIALIKGDQDSE